MAYRCSTVSTNQRLITTYYGGHDRGKVVQFHMHASDLRRYAGVTVYDHDSELLSTIEEWIDANCRNANMLIFDEDAPEKVSTVAIEVIR